MTNQTIINELIFCLEWAADYASGAGTPSERLASRPDPSRWRRAAKSARSANMDEPTTALNALITAISGARTVQVPVNTDIDIYYNGADFGLALDNAIKLLKETTHATN